MTNSENLASSFNQLVKCPSCGYQFKLSETFRAQFEEEKRREINSALRETEAKNEKQVKALEAKIKAEQEAQQKREAKIRADAEKVAQAKMTESAEQVKALEAKMQAEQEAQQKREAKIRADAEKVAQAKMTESAEQVKALEAKIKAEQEAQQKREAKIRADAEKVAQAKMTESAEQVKALEAKMQAEQEAQQKREAKIRADAEKVAQAKMTESAEQVKALEAKMQAEQEAQQKREAKIRADAEKVAQAKMTESAEQVKALEAKIKAEQEAQQKREAKIRADAEKVAQAKMTESAEQVKALEAKMQAEQEAQQKREAKIRENMELDREKHAIEKNRLEKQMADMQRQLRQTTPELQGETLEVYLKRNLVSQFPFDNVSDIRRGRKGADLTQEVIDAQLGSCGMIVWEAKRTKHWNNDWLEKIKEDADRVGAHLRVIVSESLPKDIRIFGLQEGVWVSSVEGALPLATALRSQMIESTRLQRASQGKGLKMDEVYKYLTSPRFSERIQRIVDTWIAMEEQVNREERAMRSQWKARRKQLEKLRDSTIEMYTDFSAIFGQEIAQIPGLELEALPPGDVPEVII